MPTTTTTRVVIAGAIGNIVEWYDFGLYGLLAPVLATLFFPSHDRIAALLGVYGGFAVGFAVRPLGAIVLGRVGDRQGRQFVLVLSVVLMGAATVAVGVLPSYREVGIWAPVLLIGIRLFQGFSVGGEYVGSVTYLVEAAAVNRRGLAGSVSNVGATIGMLMGAGAAALEESYTHIAWMWRVPFFFGGALAFAGYLLRRHMPADGAEAFADDSSSAAEAGPDLEASMARLKSGRVKTEQASAVESKAGSFKAHQASAIGSLSRPPTSGLLARWPVLDAFWRAPRIMLFALLFCCGYGVSDYVIMVFLPTFAHEFNGVSSVAALKINTAGQALVLLVAPLAGWLSDRWLRRRTLLAMVFAAQAAVAWECFKWTAHEGLGGLWAAQLLLAGLLAAVMGTAPAMLAEQFEHRFRVSAHAFVLNVGVGIAGGTSPMLAVALIRATHSKMAPAWYMGLACGVSAVSAMLLADRSREELGDGSELAS
ncbi:MAG TPA: MFS transporter [Terracidiphilus sp.]|nr:MFS transporter [Terracidiphilus sp.]